MKKKILSILVLLLMFIFPVAYNAEGDVVSINGQETYETLNLALAEAKNGDSIILIQNLEIDSDITIPAGITLSTTTNTLTVNADKALTIAGTLKSSSNSTVNINGTLNIDNDGVVSIGSTFNVNGTIHMQDESTINVDSTLNLIVNSKIVGNAVDGPIINISKTGSIVGSASSLSSANKVMFNNYAGRMGESLIAAVNEGYYNYYPIYDETNEHWYKTFDELTDGLEVKVLGPITVNGDTTINEGVKVISASGNAVTINGTLTVNGTYEMQNGYNAIIAANLYGNGTVIINQATEMASGWWTFVTILNDVSPTLKFEAVTGYNPNKDDILFELGTNTDDALAIAAKIKLGDSFNGYVVRTKQTNLNYVHGGSLLGVVALTTDENVVDTTPPDTGNGDLFLLGIIALSAVGCAIFCARRIYLINQI